MTPLSKEQKDSILERITFIQVELKDFEELAVNINWPVYQDDRHKRREIERLTENLANAVIDISKIVLAGETVEIPGTYQDIILKLGEMGIVNKELAAKLANLAKARNILAHQYLDLKWDLIKPLLENAPTFLKQFITLLPPM
jgi:uncharacterized protein YutE (UPF0331/DUF86 family)